jgi:BlaI family penicillinase repressor
MSNTHSSITESEEIILEILEKTNPITMKQITALVKKEKNWADSTIKTFVNRLVKKGQVTIVEKEVQYFMPVHSREKRGVTAFSEVVDKFYDGQWQQAVLSFAENEKITQEELESVLDYIKNHK